MASRGLKFLEEELLHALPEAELVTVKLGSSTIQQFSQEDILGSQYRRTMGSLLKY